MPENHHEDEKRAGRTRRSFLLWLPVVVFGSIAATLAASAYKFLRPRAADASSGDVDSWRKLARMEELNGAAPFRRVLSFEHQAGWLVAENNHPIYVFPHEGPRVLSAICPHEGCEVEWRSASREFNCPCHDSRFNAEGAPLSGPATEPLTRMPSRVRDGALEVRDAKTIAFVASGSIKISTGAGVREFKNPETPVDA